MRRARVFLVLVAGLSLLLNAVFAGMAVKLWSRSDTGAPSAVFFSLPAELRQELRAEFADTQSRIRNAQENLQAARERFQELLSEEDPDPVELQSAMSNVREATERLQAELHANIFRHFAM